MAGRFPELGCTPRARKAANPFDAQTRSLASSDAFTAMYVAAPLVASMRAIAFSGGRTLAALLKLSA